ncbi:MAG: hypothetical protein ACYDCB_10895, partial [Candidatus Dormibacteria bacterium]
MTSVDADLERRLRQYLHRRMEGAARRTSQPVLPTADGARRRIPWAACVAGLGVAVIAMALVLNLPARHLDAALTQSSVVGPGNVKIEAVSVSQGRLTSDQVPGWVVTVATTQKWQI